MLCEYSRTPTEHNNERYPQNLSIRNAVCIFIWIVSEGSIKQNPDFSYQFYFTYHDLCVFFAILEFTV